MQDETANVAQEEPIFRARLLAHRSLGRTGFLALMAALALAWLATGAIFLSLGAWPVFGFFGLDVIAVYVAFRLNYRSGRAREEITVSRSLLAIRQIAPSGRSREHRFNPFWTRFDISRHGEYGITRMAVASRGSVVAIGAFLNPDDRESFAVAFGRALADAKRG
jgi:uncharacterized membrane protein